MIFLWIGRVSKTGRILSENGDWKYSTKWEVSTQNGGVGISVEEGKTFYLRLGHHVVSSDLAQDWKLFSSRRSTPFAQMILL